MFLISIIYVYIYERFVVGRHIHTHKQYRSQKILKISNISNNFLCMYHNAHKRTTTSVIYTHLQRMASNKKSLEKIVRNHRICIIKIPLFNRLAVEQCDPFEHCLLCHPIIFFQHTNKNSYQDIGFIYVKSFQRLHD